MSIPAPRFVVFYNGVKEVEERRIFSLSDLYHNNKEKTALDSTYGGLELQVLVININRGKNKKLMELCKTLRDYSIYVATVRDYLKRFSVEEAIEKAINNCIEEDVLKEFLQKHRAEAKRMSIFEYDKEKHMQLLKDESKEEGREVGREEERISLICKIAKYHTPAEIAEMLESDLSSIELICNIVSEQEQPYNMKIVCEELAKRRNN